MAILICDCPVHCLLLILDKGNMVKENQSLPCPKKEVACLDPHLLWTEALQGMRWKYQGAKTKTN